MSTAAQAVSAGAQQQVRAILEATEATTPGTDFTIIPHASVTSPMPSNDRGPTANVASNLKVADNPLRGRSHTGSITADITHGGMDIPVRSGLNRTAHAAFTAITAQTDVAAADTGNKFTSITSGKYDGVELGIPFYMSGNSTNADGWMVATSRVTGASPELVVSHYDLATEAAGNTVTLTNSGYLTESTTLSTFSLEVADTDQSFFRILRGARTRSIEIGGQKGSDPQITCNFSGITGDSNTSTYGTGTNTAATSTLVKDMQAGFKLFSVNVGATGAPSTGLLPTGVSLTINCGDLMVDPAGSVGPASNVMARFSMTGSFTLIKNTAAHTLINAVDDDTLGNLFWVWDDGTYEDAFFLPAIEYSSVTEQGGGNDGVVTLTFNFMAQTHATYGHMFAWSKLTTP